MTTHAPECTCVDCVMAAAEAALAERRALNRVLRDMVRPHLSRRLLDRWKQHEPGYRDVATCQRLREYFK